MLSHKFLTHYLDIKRICDQQGVTDCHIEMRDSVGNFPMHVLVGANA
jgi:hypothetical protein